MEELIYPFNGRAMHPEPLDRTLDDVAVGLRAGESVSVVLEPGDATRYNLCLVPCWSPLVYDSLGSVGIPKSRANEYLLVVKFDSSGGSSWFAHSQIEHYDVGGGVQNQWSRELLAWWLRELWKRLTKPAEASHV
ncbi:MAG: hypothetical protein GTO63_30120 [Anaerolineae bacterium]|nr:hypothetical protein [Anaerolineae bacterium]NIN98962.1 hypothetical protein [Anaerolineae bacterium]